MRAMKPMMLLCVVGALLAGGCASVRVTTNLKPESDPALKSPAGQFYVAGLKFTGVDGPDVRYSKEYLDTYQARLLPLVRSECIARYPLLFAQDSTKSIPLWVEVNERITFHKGKMLAWMFGTLTLVPIVFPAPMVQLERDIDVTVGLWNGRDGMGSGTMRKDFHRDEHAWMTLLTPLALITIPGESDFPKTSTAFNMSRFMYDDVPQVAQQVATALAKLVVTQDSAYWTAQPREQVTPGVPSALPALPTVLPPPAETAAPF